MKTKQRRRFVSDFSFHSGSGFYSFKFAAHFTFPMVLNVPIQYVLPRPFFATVHATVCWLLHIGLPLVERCTYVRAFPVTYVTGMNATL